MKYNIFFILVLIFFNDLIFSQDSLENNSENYQLTFDSLYFDFNSSNFTRDTIVSELVFVDTNDFHPNINITIEIKKIANAEFNIDGELNEGIWHTLNKYKNFCEVSPGDNTKPEVETEFMITYDEDYLYIGFVCYENNMKKLRKTLTKRDNAFSDDFIGIIFDTYSEGKNAYELFVNPYGVQGDGMWLSNGNEDMNFDLIWYSDAKIYSDKWTAEIAIPFKSIKFPQGKDWHFHVIRNRPRENRYQYSFIKINRNDPTLFTNYATLKGISNVKAGKNIELIPYILGSQKGSKSDFNNVDSEFENEKIKINTGFNLKYSFTSNLIGEFTLNPDFSQVEADASVINMNNTYAIFYTEKRPFFNEGANIFKSFFRTVYTRSINNPLFAIKLTGKVNKSEIGFISAYDKKTPFIVPYKESSDFLVTDRKSFSNIFRYKYSPFNDDSYFGITITDREVNKEGNKFWNPEGYNRVFSFDGSYRFLENYTVGFQFIKSFTKEIYDTNYASELIFGNDKHTGKFDGEYFNGLAAIVNFQRTGEHYNFDLEYSMRSPEVRMDNGFNSNNDFHSFETGQSYVFYVDKDFLKRIEPSLRLSVSLDYGGNLREQFAIASVWFLFKNQLQLYLGNLLVNNEEFKGRFLTDVRRMWINFNANTFVWLDGGFNLEIGRFIIRNDNPSVGFGIRNSLWVNFKPLDNLVFSINHNYFELSESYKGTKLFAGYILRNSTNYQILKDISFRFIIEYNSFANRIYINPLLTYQPNPFTIFYLGFASQYDNLNDMNGFSKYTLSDRQFFLKMQYLFKF
ncbi:MAG: carbohydrate binding family 9 domain-containing protein [Ignavibacteria bacterium]|nr:carbohydrate binding family 9 domain-containing protein [Ignavibacteria bacterium]